ncbi:tRNA guanosine-2'-O-methyltransferase [Ascodesmis nigricans]|uniref:tRNA (guanine(10)-N(2))-methyltransferase n=1 Tax=Ascodesmis nigricans TaxID=341454 RepID=A0A4S2MTA1_9PEZI|nr:tRNA guanosine-2'-O-methyltransferase [Ascodesmis nigricans]
MTASDILPAQEYLIHFAQIHECFRQPEINALAKRHSLPLVWKSYSNASPFAIITLPSDTDARTIISDSILAKAIYRLLAHSSDYDSLHALLRSRPELIPETIRKATFKFTIESYLHKRSKSSQRSVINGFAHLPLTGTVTLDKPEVKFTVFEEFPGSPGIYRQDGPTNPISVGLGVFLSHGSRSTIDTYDLKKRLYIGTTSMDAELSLVTCNLAMAGPGKILYDPFSGTGSFLVTASHFGAMTLGSDIDGRQIRGKKPGKNVIGNFKQYGITSRYLDGFTADLTNTPLRSTRFLDGIVSDPPYGVREGLKVLGHKDPAKNGSGEPVVVDGVVKFKEPDYIPPKRPYSFNAMLDDICRFAAAHLVDAGRLCFWVPATNEDGIEMQLPKHPALELIAVCPQQFNNWSRWLLVYERIPGELDSMQVPEKQAVPQRATASELNNFRKKYFEGFNQKPTSPSTE